MTVNNNFKPIITYLLLVDNPLVNNKIVTKEAKHNGYVWIGKSGTVDMGIYKKVITMSFIPKKCRSCHSDCFFGA